MYPFEFPHNCYQSNPHNRSRGECQYNNPRNRSIMPERNEDDQHPSPHFNYQPSPSNYNHPIYYHYGAPPHLSYAQPPPPPPVPPCYYAHYYPPYPAYFIPPPPPSPCNYSMDCHHHPCYDDYYNRNNKTHCCGCSNHTCQPGNDASSSLRIQEEPFQQSEIRESNDTVPPSKHTPPIVWQLPSSESKYGEKELEKDGVGKSGSQSPSYPVIWLPGNSGFEEAARDKNANASKSAQGWPSNLKFVPMKFLENGGNAQPESEANKVSPPVDKNFNIKTIPVKKVDDRSSFVSDKGEGNMDKTVEEAGKQQSSNVKNVPLKFFESGEGTQQKAHDPVVKKEIKTKTIPVKHVDEKSSEKDCDMSSDKNKKEKRSNGKEESSNNDASEKKKLPSTKSSKLPPICLRVGPRPKKTLANSSSTLKPTTTSTMNSNGNKERNEEPSHEKIIPVNTVKESNQNEHVIPVKDDNLSHGKKDQVCEENTTISPSEKNTWNDDSSKASEVISGGSNIENHEKTGTEDLGKTSEPKINVDEEKVVEHTKMINEKINEKRLLSETDAATIIQSVYRGFEVRRWQPLEKLKKIAQIREETDKVSRQVDDIEACPSSQLNAKKTVVLGETIMNLLLQLDMIQGLHPSVKEVRKSLAKELTCLEDRLDSIYSRIAKEHGSSNLDENQADSLKCESNFASPAPESMDDNLTNSDAELKTKSDINLDSSFSGDDKAADATSSTLVCEVTSEHDVQVDNDNVTKDHEVIQEESSEHLSNFVSSAPDTLKSESSKPDSMDDKITPSGAEPQMKSDVNLEFAPSGDDGTADYTFTTLAREAACDRDMQVDNDSGIKEHEVIQEGKSPSCKEIVDEGEIGEDVTQPSVEPVSMSDDGAAADVMSTIPLPEAACEHDERVDDDNDMKEHEIIEEMMVPSNKERVEEEEMKEEVKQPLEPTLEEDTNTSHVLVHQAENEHLEEKDDSVERPADDAEPNNIAADELPSVNSASADALEEDDANTASADDDAELNNIALPQNCTSVESMDVEQESSTDLKSDGDSIAAGADVYCSEKQDSLLEDDSRNNVAAIDDKQFVGNELEVSEAATEEDADITRGREVEDDYVKSDVMKGKEMQLFEENEKLRKMIEELAQSGNKQLNVITNLNERVKDLEKKLQLTKKKKMKVRRSKAAKKHTSEEVGGN